MAISVRHEDNSFERYIAEVRSVWGDGKDPELPFKVRALMEKMLKSTSPEEPWMAELLRDAKPSRAFKDPDPRLLGEQREEPGVERVDTGHVDQCLRA